MTQRDPVKSDVILRNNDWKSLLGQPESGKLKRLICKIICEVFVVCYCYQNSPSPTGPHPGRQPGENIWLRTVLTHLITLAAATIGLPPSDFYQAHEGHQLSRSQTGTWDSLLSRVSLPTSSLSSETVSLLVLYFVFTTDLLPVIKRNYWDNISNYNQINIQLLSWTEFRDLSQWDCSFYEDCT